GGLLRKLLPRPLPAWAGEIGCSSWAQLLLKFVLANKAVTCVIPGTGKPEHMRDNVQAGLGTYPNAVMLQRVGREIAVEAAALASIADVPACAENVCFGPQADIGASIGRRPRRSLASALID